MCKACTLLEGLNKGRARIGNLNSDNESNEKNAHKYLESKTAIQPHPSSSIASSGEVVI